MRPPTVWFRKQDQWYYTTIRGEKIKLSKDKKEAQKAFHTLMAHGTVEHEGPRPKLRTLVGLFLDEAEKNNEPDTYRNQRKVLVDFSEWLGATFRAPELRVHHVYDWLKTRTWGDSTKRLGISIICACLNWAADQQRIDNNPIKGIKRPKGKRREQIVPEGDMAKVLEAVSPELRDFLTFLSLTGARPFSEAAKLTKDMIDWANGRIPFEKHKNAKKGKERVVYLCPEAEEILRRRQTNPVFVSPQGLPWTRQSCNAQIRRACKRAGVTVFTSYATRRSYITGGLARGLTSSILSQLCGTSERIIERHYNSLHLRPDALKDAARRAAG